MTLGDSIERMRVKAMRTLQGWATEKRVLRGIPVTLVNTRPDIDSELVFTRLETALGLIQRYRPETFANLANDVSRIHVERFPCRGAFFQDTRVCLTELTFTVNPEFAESQIGSSIVHEGMHARVHATRAYAPVELPAEERMCRQAELEFGRAIPDGDAVVRRAIESLALGDDDVAPAIDWEAARRAVLDADSRTTRQE